MKLALLLAVFCLVGDATPSAPDVLKLDQGELQGRYDTSYGGRRYLSFMGVPYAAPPVGRRRFQPPDPVESWTGIRNATRLGAPCLQYRNTESQDKLAGSEDCLFLNVYTPDVAPSEPMDVIVFLHGGAFMYGGGHMPQPVYIMDTRVVLVTLNYRLGVLGFLSTGDLVVPGNNGLKDQVAALHWVNKNIAAFGGNPKSITLAGLSAGGASVHYHYMSPLSRSLFHRGISMSGTSFCQWAQADALPEKSKRLGALLGCPSSSSTRLVECLLEKPAVDIVQLTQHFQFWRYTPFSPWGPTEEPPHPSAFLTKKPDVILSTEVLPQIPWLVGLTSEEGLYPAAEYVANVSIMQDLESHWNEICPHLLDFNFTTSSVDHQQVSQQIRRYYLQNDVLSPDNPGQLIQMIGDRHFVVEIERSARQHAYTTRAPVFFYRFSYRGQQSFSDVMSNTSNNYGTSHGDDLSYILHQPFLKGTVTSKEDQSMSHLLLKMWTSFASTGTPVVDETDWTPISPGSDNLDYLHIGSASDVSMRSTQDLGNRVFWDTLPFNVPTNFKDEL